MVGMATVLAVLRLKAPGTLEYQGQYHPAAPKTFFLLSFFLSLLSCFLKAEVILAKSFGGGGKRVGSQRESSC